jgi:hypothetical protein
MKEDYIDATLGNDRDSDLAGYIGDGLAVSRNWNKFQRILTMELKEGEAVHAWTGLAHWQLEWETLPNGRILGGGLPQYLMYDLWKAPNRIFSAQSLVSLCWDWGKMISGVQVKNLHRR